MNPNPIFLHPDARSDLAAIRNTNPKAWGRIVALLEQIKCDPKLVDKLLDHKFEETHGEIFSVSKFLEFWNAGLDIWRIKAVDPKSPAVPFRIVYAYDMKGLRFYVLAVVDRSFNYDANHNITKRIRGAYEELGLPIS